MRSIISAGFAALFAVAFAPNGTLAQQGNGRLPTDTAVTVGTLPNGLRYYVRHNSRPEKRAELRLVVNAGSVLEDPDQRGSRMVDMAFNGTHTSPSRTSSTTSNRLACSSGQT
jgi:zinc protease